MCGVIGKSRRKDDGLELFCFGGVGFEEEEEHVRGGIALSHFRAS